MLLIHDYNNLKFIKEGYESLGEPENAYKTEEVMRMIKSGSLKTKAQVISERKKRGIERR